MSLIISFRLELINEKPILDTTLRHEKCGRSCFCNMTNVVACSESVSCYCSWSWFSSCYCPYSCHHREFQPNFCVILFVRTLCTIQVALNTNINLTHWSCGFYRVGGVHFGSSLVLLAHSKSRNQFIGVPWSLASDRWSIFHDVQVLPWSLASDGWSTVWSQRLPEWVNFRSTTSVVWISPSSRGVTYLQT